MWASWWRTISHIACGYSAPAPALMFLPSGLVWIAVTFAPSSSNTAGPTR